MKVIYKIEDWYKEYAKSCEFVAKWLVKKLKINSKSTIVDLGCGAGAFTIPLALAVKNSKVIAIDSDERVLKELNLNIKKFNVKNSITIKCDAKNLQTIKDNSIDFVFSHWLLNVVTSYNDLRKIFKGKLQDT